MPTVPKAEAAKPEMEDVVSVVVDLEGEDALVDVVRAPRDARTVIQSLRQRYPDQPILGLFGVDIKSPEFGDESHIVRGEN